MKRPAPARSPRRRARTSSRTREGRVLYVGKAKNLRSRLLNYFAPPDTLPARTRQMVASAATVEWIEVRNEVEALFLEYNLIKRHRPRFNIRYKDDKSYPYLAVTLDEEWPRAMVMRGQKRKDVPLLRARTRTPTRSARRSTCCCGRSRSAPARSPSSTATTGSGARASTRTSRSARRRASTTITKADYDALVGELLAFLDGEHGAGARPPRASRCTRRRDALEFERAARLRDQLFSVRKAVERQQMVAPKEEDLDVIGLAEDPIEASVQVFFVRRGRVVGREGWSSTRWKTSTPASSSARSSSSSTATPRPTTCRARSSCPRCRRTSSSDEEFLGLARGAKVRVRVPQRGPSASCSRWSRTTRRRRSPSTSSAARPTTTPAPARSPRCRRRSTCPRRRCGSSASTSPTSRAPRSSASMVVMEDGLAEARPTTGGSRSSTTTARTTSRRWRRCSPVASVATSTSATRVPAPGSASRTRPTCCSSTAARASSASPCGCSRSSASRTSRSRRWRSASRRSTGPASTSPIRIPRDSEALYLLQQVRDEAHRFAITYHRQLRGKRSIQSVLDDVPGLGPVRRNRLLQGVRLGEGAAGLHRGGARRAPVAARRRSPGRCTAASTAASRPRATRRATMEAP